MCIQNFLKSQILVHIEQRKKEILQVIVKNYSNEKIYNQRKNPHDSESLIYKFKEYNYNQNSTYSKNVQLYRDQKLTSLVMINQIKDQETTKTLLVFFLYNRKVILSYYIKAIIASPQRFSPYSRKLWQGENKLKKNL